MAVTINELISKRDEIRAKKNNLYELETSIGTIVAKMPSSKIVADAWNLDDNMEGNQLLILECVVNPNLKDKELQRAYGCAEPLDIVAEIFEVGEISGIASELLKLAKFNGDIKSKIYKEVKN